MDHRKITTEKAAELLDHMKPGDTLRRERDQDGKLVWHFQRYHGNNWLDITSELLERAIKEA